MTAADPRYLAFIRTAVATGSVYTLQDHEDFLAECPSEVYDDEWGEPVPVYCVWDNPDDAEDCRREEWENYSVNEWPIQEFMHEVLLESDQEAALMGVAFDEQLYGTEIEPVELLADLLNEIQRQGLDGRYDRFAELQSYRLQWEHMMQGGQTVH